jgi:hypothetical protein
MDPATQARNELEPLRKFKGVWICGMLWFDTALNPTEKFLIAEIDSLTGNGEPCFAGNKYLADHLQTSETHMRDMLADLTARGYLVRLGFNGRQTLRCVRPDLSSNPASSKQLIKQFIGTDSSSRKFPIPKGRYRKNPIPALGNIRDQKSGKSDAEISKREDKGKNDDDQTKLHAQRTSQPVVVVASSCDALDQTVADCASEIRKTDFGKSENRRSPNRESEPRENRETDFSIKKQENTTENTHKRNDDDQLKLHAQLPSKQPVVVASSWPGDDDEPSEIVEKLTEKLKLSYDQSKTVQFYLDQDGKGYVLEKVRITRSKDLQNAGGFFITALEKDYREPVTNRKPAPRPKKKRVGPKPQEPQATDEERAKTSAKLREFVERLRALSPPI